MDAVEGPHESPAPKPDRMPAIYLGHGAPPLIEDTVWPRELASWAGSLPRPTAILVVSAHWESAPVTIGATTTVPLVYDFYGFPEHYYEITYASPGAPALAERVRALLGTSSTVRDDPTRGLDHGAYMPLLFMYPAADIPVLQISMPSEDPQALMEMGRLLAPLRDEGVLIMGSGFLTHSFDAIRQVMSGLPLPQGVVESTPGPPRRSRGAISTLSSITAGALPRSATRIARWITSCLCSSRSARASTPTRARGQRSRAFGWPTPSAPSSSASRSRRCARCAFLRARPHDGD